MAVIKCKMCGGSLNITEDSSVCECEYCGTKQTVPKADDEKKLKLFDRAGRLLRGCEFDKAAGVFESIVADFPEEAEAYWGLVLCKYGIEYVDDPSTGKKIPTCHRSSFESVLDDQNFEQACEFSEPVARRVYRDEARAIEALRQAILQVSGREEPYDVFISYKETDGEGQRTLDSVIAQDIYKELTNEGYRVFFSRISLEDKLGTEYEPYIFAALNSAKVMLVVGTDYENFDAVWVKNEWSRFLKLIAKGEKKTLIPVFKNMDAYDMPKEFAKLSAQDMGKVGAMQDLIRGVEKILGKKQAEPGPAQQVIQQVIQGGGPNVTALLKRGRQALEDGAWEKADGFYEQVLSMDAENGEAFLGKFCAEAHAISLDSALNARLRKVDAGVRSAERQIERQSEREQRLVAENPVLGYLKVDRLTPLLPQRLDYPSALDYRQRTKTNEMIALHTNKLLTRAERYAKGELAGEIKSSLSRFEGELDARILDAETATAAAKAEREKTYEAELRQAEESAEKLRREAEEKREQDYQACCRALEQAQTREQYRDVEQKLGQPGLKQYKDCAALAERCRDGIAALQEKERRAALQKQEEAYQAAAGLEKKARTEEELRAAVSAFRAVGDFRDAESHAKALQEQADALKAKAEAEAAERLREQQAREARALAAKKKKQRLIAILASAAVVLAVAAFLVVTKVIIPGNAYKAAESLLEAGQYEEAAAAFEALGDYKDAPDQALEALYLRAEALEAQGDHEGAIAAFEALGNYKDSGTRAQEIRYTSAERLLEAGQYEEAAAAFEALGGWRDSGARAKEARAAMEEELNAQAYAAADALLQEGRRAEAAIAFSALGEYADARERSFALWEEITQRETIAAVDYHTVGLRSNGTVVAVGDNTEGRCNVSGWTDIVAISAGGWHTVGLRSDGTVVTAGSNGSGQCDVSDWTDVVAVSAGYIHTVGLRSDGTVVAVGYNDDGQCNVSGWTDIVAVSAGSFHTVGLRSDGTVVATEYTGEQKYNYGQCDVSGWTDIVAVSAGGWCTVGLRSDGTVVAVGRKDYGQCDVSGWTDIVAVSAGGWHTVGLRADGTVVAVGKNDASQCDVGGWTDVVAVSAGVWHTVGLRADGTVVAVGSNGLGRCDVGDWRNIKLPN